MGRRRALSLLGVDAASRHELLLVAHVLLLVYWLGADLGVFYSSRFMLRPDLTPAARGTAAKIMHGIDLGPRICLVLMVPVGLTLAADLGLSPVDGAALGAIWVVDLLWLAAVVWSYTHEAATPTWLRTGDLALRAALASGFIGWGAWSLATDRGLLTDWLPWKAVLFGTAIACGLAIRLRLPAFGRAFGLMLSGDVSAANEAALRTAMVRVQPFVFGIWGCVAGAAVLGLTQP